MRLPSEDRAADAEDPEAGMGVARGSGAARVVGDATDGARRVRISNRGVFPNGNEKHRRLKEGGNLILRGAWENLSDLVWDVACGHKGGTSPTAPGSAWSWPWSYGTFQPRLPGQPDCRERGRSCSSVFIVY